MRHLSYINLTIGSNFAEINLKREGIIPAHLIIISIV